LRGAAAEKISAALLVFKKFAQAVGVR